MATEFGYLFAHEYEFEVLMEFPPHEHERRYYYPGAAAGGSDGLIVRVTPLRGSSWIGVFAFGSRFETLMTGVFTHPDPGLLCVVSRGAGYFVKANAPENCTVIDVVPITTVKQVAEKPLLLFADFTCLSAYGKDGRIWRTRRLSWDGIEISTIDDQSVCGKGSDPTSAQAVPFCVNLTTGEASGGSAPENYI